MVKQVCSITLGPFFTLLAMINHNPCLKCHCSCLVSTSCPTLFANPWTVARQSPLSKGFPRQEYWSGLPYPYLGEIPNSEMNPGMELISCIDRQILYQKPCMQLQRSKSVRFKVLQRISCIILFSFPSLLALSCLLFPSPFSGSPSDPSPITHILWHPSFSSLPHPTPKPREV